MLRWAIVQGSDLALGPVLGPLFADMVLANETSWTRYGGLADVPMA